MNYSIEHLSFILRATLISSGTRDRYIHNIITDSRAFLATPDTTMFCAIRTAARDGHAFIAHAYERGVRCFLLDNPAFCNQPFPDAAYLLVESVIDAIQQLAAYHRSQFTYPVIGVTGSGGKTIVKDWLAYLLAPFGLVVKSPRSYNSQIGVPLSIFAMEQHHQFAVFEAGISEPGQMERLQRMIKPDIGIFTGIGAAHDEFFQSRTQKIDEKLLLFQGSKKLIVCSEHHEVLNRAILMGFEPRQTLFVWGKSPDADLRVLDVQQYDGTLRIHVDYADKRWNISIPFTDTFSYQNAMHILAAALVLGFKMPNMITYFSTLPAIAMRFEMIEGIHNTLIINDTYNFDIESLAPSLEYLENNKFCKKTVVILSDVLQTRKKPEQLYAEVAHLLHAAKIHSFIGIGPEIYTHQHLFKDIPESNFYTSTETFLEHVDKSQLYGAIILIKGARKFSFERIVHALEQKTHQTVLEVSLSNLAWNIRQFRQLLHPATRIMAIVKAFSYGTGSYEIARFLESQGIDYLAVAFVDEGVMLRQKGIKIPIMVMAPEIHQLVKMQQYQLEPEVYSLEMLHKFANVQTERFRIHLKLDTGMHRLGIAPEDLPEVCRFLKYNSHIEVISVFSHLAEAEHPHSHRTLHQIALFEQMTDQLEQELNIKPLKHVLNTSGVFYLSDNQYDMIRLGIGMYGIQPIGALNLHLLPVLKLKTKIIQIKKLPKGAYVGYGNLCKLDKDSTIAVIPIGYADGFSRKMGFGRGVVYIKGIPCRVIGSVCMDLTMIDVTAVDAAVGDEVIIFDDIPKLRQLAEKMETIPYEVIAAISQRVRRQYIYE